MQRLEVITADTMMELVRLINEDSDWAKRLVFIGTEDNQCIAILDNAMTLVFVSNYTETPVIVAPIELDYDPDCDCNGCKAKRGETQTETITKSA